ncbi:MAG: SDR family NAD(P)-dependent oxidoreductase [Melioribacteraceae bacterium]|nr:SDR family NAD(P)-dependent oxidoreductase [Melioribacteraceae bacterium]MCF8355709.1 SDR family NAD(P)-dependent oxidoreductase [Melioribacteraceae bacterium]MCF8394439.1 SDR family NAD(P)-dependent oxidoreductase [Melioribacteraceae bacterium]MCF8418573.1 SDR family NAD(P)-dependent oxidoreductase [Melioribacteraceae bacterium]
MESLNGKVVLITGATAGIGKSCSYAFAEEGANLIITGRRHQKLIEISNDLKTKFNVKVLTQELDVRNRTAIESFIESLDGVWKNIDILVNNAGLGRGLNRLYKDNPEGWEEMIDTNIKGLLYMTGAVVKGMAERKSGHVINIGSIAGHEAYSGGAVYCATKHAVNAITKSLRLDTLDKNIKVSTVDPGMVETEFSKVRFYGDEEKANNVYKGMTPLTGDDIAETVIFCATRPKHVNINEIIVMPSAQASAFFTYRGE